MKVKPVKCGECKKPIILGEKIMWATINDPPVTMLVHNKCLRKVAEREGE